MSEIGEINRLLEVDNKKVEEIYSKIFGASMKLCEQIEIIRKFTHEASEASARSTNKRNLFKIQKALVDLQLKASFFVGQANWELNNPKNYKPLYIEDTDETAPTEEKEEEARVSEQEPNQL